MEFKKIGSSFKVTQSLILQVHCVINTHDSKNIPFNFFKICGQDKKICKQDFSKLQDEFAVKCIVRIKNEVENLIKTEIEILLNTPGEEYLLIHKY